MINGMRQLDDRVRRRLEDAGTALLEEGRLLSRAKLDECHALFMDRFGPERLRALSGIELLETMHLHADHDSLVYWLEFKDDDEFPKKFGNIGGGSALKFGIYRRKETGVWMAGHSTKQIELRLDEAIAVAERHREQLIAGVAVLAHLPVAATFEDYARAQGLLEERAPDVQGVGWGHKYFSLMYPDRLDDYHTAAFQRFHLIKCLVRPPDGKEGSEEIGKYVSAYFFARIAAELGVPLNHLTKIMNRAHGRPHATWRLGTRVGGDRDISVWQMMRETGAAAIGWPDLGDLSWVKHDLASRNELARLLAGQGLYSGAPQVSSRKAREIMNFVAGMQEGDFVLACDGLDVLGVGTVTGGYAHDPGDLPDAPHHRPVAWSDATPFTQAVREGLMTTFVPIRGAVNLIDVEARTIDAQPAVVGPKPSAPAPRRTRILLDGVPGRVQAVIERKSQAILYGPPGTGKTKWALAAARDLAAAAAFGRRYGDLAEAEKADVDGAAGAPGLVRTCTFHPGYGYEDFIEGFRPAPGAAGLAFVPRDGAFKRLCRDALARPERDFILVVDEINRGDVPRIFGELITLLEKDKRGLVLELPVSGEAFHVPANVAVIGTMNTADRSIALLDTALRRRFGFVELLPDYRPLDGAAVGGVPLGQWLRAVNAAITVHVGRDARNLQIGHAFLLEDGAPIRERTRLARIVAEDLVPLVGEYCYEDWEAMRAILGDGLVDAGERRIKDELFRDDRLDDLMEALLQPFPDIVTAAGATAAADDPSDDLDEPSGEPGED